MNFDFIRLPFMFVVLCAVQVFIFNHIQLFGCAMPLFYVWFIVTMKKGYPKWAIMVWAFVMGITLDIFTNTPGVTAASLTAAGMAQPYLLDLFMTRDTDDQIIPSASTIGKKPYANYTIVLVFSYCALYYTLEMFSFMNGLKWLECVVGSAVLTIALVLTFDRLRYRG